jgi:hypothetical protein
MKEIIAITVLTLIYISISYKFHLFLLKAKKASFIFLCIVYLVFTYFLFDGAGYLHQYLRDKGIYFEFGHADEFLVEIFLLWLVLGLVNITIALIRRNLKKDNPSKSELFTNSSRRR